MRSFDIITIEHRVSDRYDTLLATAESTLKSLEDELHRTYCPDAKKPRFHSVLFNGIPDYLANIFAVMNDVKDATFIDIGCGSTDPNTCEGREYTNGKVGRYEPWLARTLHHLGANVIGIDIGASPGELFSFRQANFMTEPLPVSEHVDIALCFNVVSSPELDLRYRHILGPTFPLIAWDVIEQEVARVMPNGTFIHNRRDSLAAMKEQEQDGLTYHKKRCITCVPQGILERLRI